MILSGDYLAIFDPQKEYVKLERSGAARMKISKMVFKSHLEPFDIVAKTQDWQTDTFSGTAVRLPVRKFYSTGKHIKHETWDTSSIKSHLSYFEEQTPIVLLFLNHVKSITMSIYSDNEETVTCTVFKQELQTFGKIKAIEITTTIKQITTKKIWLLSYETMESEEV
jgi:hypothetical protein